jgi:hypothetical protein
LLFLDAKLIPAITRGMKRIKLTVLATAICYCFAYPQPCLPQGITFTAQEQIDNFQTYYPGCTEIEGSVHIGVTSQTSTYITNLNGLSKITSIGGQPFNNGND